MNAFSAAVAALLTIACGAKAGGQGYTVTRIPNKWERMTGKPCRPHDRTGLPTSPPPPRRAGR